MTVKDLLPKDKSDNSNLKKISKLNDTELSTIIYDLFGWIQDYNWPISNEVLQILISRQNLVFPYISDVLTGKDGILVDGKMQPDFMWQYWILELLIPHLEDEYKLFLESDIESLAMQTATNEDVVNVVEQAKVCLKKCFAK